MGSNTEKAAASSSRYERKFAVADLSVESLKAVIKLHPAHFREIHHGRQINNIYLDTPGFKAFSENTAGISKRKKIRIRWYGSTFGEVKGARLEYKKKSGMLGNKDIWKLANFHLGPGFDQETLQTLLQRSELPNHVYQELQIVHPALMNAYYRTYYQSADRAFRITIDEALTYFDVSKYNNCFLKRHQDRKQTILELKYDAIFDERADDITRHFAFRLTKSSKYVNGMDRNRPFIAF